MKKGKGSAPKKPTWTSTGRKKVCKDGVERTLFRNSVNGDLRVRRISKLKGNQVMRYVKP